MELLKHGEEILVAIAGRISRATVQTGHDVNGAPLGHHRGDAYFIVKRAGAQESDRMDYEDEGITWTRDVSRDGADALKAAYLLNRSAGSRLPGIMQGFIEGMLRRPIL